jgi:hypothetical protein
MWSFLLHCSSDHRMQLLFYDLIFLHSSFLLHFFHNTIKEFSIMMLSKISLGDTFLKFLCITQNTWFTIHRDLKRHDTPSMMLYKLWVGKFMREFSSTLFIPNFTFTMSKEKTERDFLFLGLRWIYQHYSTQNSRREKKLFIAF